MTASWGSLKLKDCCLKIGSGATPKGGKNAYLDHGEFRLIRSQNIHNNSFHYDGLAFISEAQAKELKSVEVQKDDVLLNITGDSVARSCKVREDVLPARVNQHVMIIRADGVKLHHDFLRYWLVSPSTQELLLNLAQGGATRNALTKGMVEDLEIPAMPFAEQLQVTTFLNSISDEIDILKLQNITLESIAQTLFKSWFVNFDPVHAKAAGREPEGLSGEITALFPSEFEESELGLIPKGWTIKSFGECLTFTIGGDWGSENPKAESDVQAKIIRGTDIPALRISNSDKVPTRHIKASKFGQRQLRLGDLVIEVSGGSTDQSTGRSLRVTSPILSHLGNSVAPTSFCRLFRPQPGFSELLALRLDYLYDSGAMWGYQVQSTGIANFQTQLFLEKEKFAVPPATLLKKFSDLVSPMIENTFDESVVVLKNLRDELLPRLISGKIRIEEAEEALADAMPSTEKQVA